MPRRSGPHLLQPLPADRNVTADFPFSPPPEAAMSVTPRVSTPVSVGRFVASVRAVAASSDGLVVCAECQRHMSDMAETCPHCNSAAASSAPRASMTGEYAVDSVRFRVREFGSISLVIACLVTLSYFALRVAAS